MGGMVCNQDTETDLKGLFVAGEDAGGMHGANRLGGNGVANSTVFGGIAGEVMAEYLASDQSPRSPEQPDTEALSREQARALAPVGRRGGDINRIRDDLMEVMWDHVGIIRSREGLKQGLAAIGGLREELDASGIGDQDLRFNLSWHDWLNVDNLLTISEVICLAALAREDSRGAHFREDFPDTGDLDSSAYTVVQRTNDRLSVNQEAVEFSIVRPGQSLVAGEAAMGAASG